MCEYCGCQALASIAALTAEHDQIVTMLGQARALLDGGDVAGAARVARRVTRVLGPHTVVEEQGLFPALVDDFPDHVERLREQHRHVEAVLDEADVVLAHAVNESSGGSLDGSVDGAALAGWPGRLRAASTLLRDHILAEQDGVFPAALAILSPQQWAEVDGVRASVGSGLTGESGRGRHRDHRHEY